MYSAMHDPSYLCHTVALLHMHTILLWSYSYLLYIMLHCTLHCCTIAHAFCHGPSYLIHYATQLHCCTVAPLQCCTAFCHNDCPNTLCHTVALLHRCTVAHAFCLGPSYLIHYATLLHRCTPFCHGPSYPNTLCHAVALLHSCFFLCHSISLTMVSKYLVPVKPFMHMSRIPIQLYIL